MSPWNNIIERGSLFVIAWQENTTKIISMTNDRNLNANFETERFEMLSQSLCWFSTSHLPNEQHNESQTFTNGLCQREGSPKLQDLELIMGRQEYPSNLASKEKDFSLNKCSLMDREKALLGLIPWNVSKYFQVQEEKDFTFLNPSVAFYLEDILDILFLFR